MSLLFRRPQVNLMVGKERGDYFMTRFTLSDAMLLVGMLCVCFSVVTFPSERTDLALTILVGLSVTNLLHCGLIELRTLGRSTRLFLGIAIAIFIVLRPIPGSRNLGIEMYYLLHDSKETRSTLSIDSLRDTFLSSVDLLCACLIAVALASGNIVIRAVHYKISGNKDSSQL
jgi:hypothetical protein